MERKTPPKNKENRKTKTAWKSKQGLEGQDWFGSDMVFRAVPVLGLDGSSRERVVLYASTVLTKVQFCMVSVSVPREGCR